MTGKIKIYFAFIIIMLLCVLFALPSEVEARTLSLTELIEDTKEYDGKIISFEGEAIGNILYRGNHAFVNISDAGNSVVGVWMTADEARNIKVLGHYGTQGDTVYVKGVFNNACSEHGGDPDIHAQSVSIIESGRNIKIQIPVTFKVLLPTTVSAMLILCVFAIYRIRLYNNGQKSK